MGATKTSSAAGAKTSASGRATWSERLRELHPRRFFLETWAQIDREAASEREALAGTGKRDWVAAAALIFGAMCLTVMDNEYFGGADAYRHAISLLANQPWFAHWAAPRLLTGPDAQDPSTAVLVDAIHAARFYDFGGHAWWAAWRVIGFFLLPMLFVKLGLRKNLRDFGLEMRGMRQHLWIYGLMYSCVLVLVIAVSFTDSFANYYPFYKLAQRSWLDFLGWELLYASQFFSLEFFFRGFWLAACRRAMGSWAIFAMVVPYCMIHFGKPMPETFGAIFAGVALGTLAMKTRSIWSGFLIHVSVALSMDVAALLQTSSLPSVWWPT